VNMQAGSLTIRSWCAAGGCAVVAVRAPAGAQHAGLSRQGRHRGFGGTSKLRCSKLSWNSHMMTVGAQLEDVLSWQCGHPQVRSMQASAGKDGTEASGDLQLDVLSNLERHVDRLSAFSDEEDEAELHNLYMVCPPAPNSMRL
jgi:hypothetical protein